MMNQKGFHTVTGGFGFSGKYIVEKLVEMNEEVHILTNSTERENPWKNKVQVLPFNFKDPKKLIESLKGCKVLYNTYWIRFNHKNFSHREAVENTLILFEAAKKAGVKRVVHVSITNPDINSSLEYFRGKAELEKALMDSGLSYAILRPAVIFGEEDILIHNIAWMLRKFPVFGHFGSGKYRLQPIHVRDFRDLAIKYGMSNSNSIIDAVGPETFTYKGLVQYMAKVFGIKRIIVPVPAFLGYWISLLIGKIVNDILVTKEEINGLMDDLLYVTSVGKGKIKLSAWIKENKLTLGTTYRSELARRLNREKSYQKL